MRYEKKLAVKRECSNMHISRDFLSPPMVDDGNSRGDLFPLTTLGSVLGFWSARGISIDHGCIVGPLSRLIMHLPAFSQLGGPHREASQII